MKKLIAIALFASLCLTVCSCKKDNTDTDEKPKEVTESVEEVPEQPENQSEQQEDESSKEEGYTFDGDVPKLIEWLGGEMSGEETEFFADATAFAEAVMGKNTDVISEYTGGEAGYYDFLTDVHVTEYTLYPFTFSQQVLDEMMAGWKYPVAGAHYFAEFKVVSTESEDFPLGKAVFYMGFSETNFMGNKLSLFIPAKDAENHMFVTSNEDARDDYIEYFIRELVSEYYHNLADGRSYPDSFSFYDSVHFITHLMANCGEYAAISPYTMDEINDFIMRSFDGNDGVDSEKLDYMVWLHDVVLDEIPADDRMYGCSLSHGLAIAEHKIVDIRTDGNSRIYTVELYADYSHFAPASTVVFYFDVNENELPKLTMVDLRDNTAREPAVVAV